MLGVVPGPSSLTHRRSSSTTCFRTYTASRAVPLPTKQLDNCSAKATVATAISSSGWLAIATSAEVRLYRKGIEGRKGIIKIDAKVALKPTHGKKIRDIALSDDLLVLVTSSHLLVYEYRDPNGLGTPMERQIDQGGRWRAKGVKILQNGSVRRGSGAQAWIAVGGQGQNGVNLFRSTYSSHSNCWSLQDERVVLLCPGNTGFVRLVGFSPERFNRDQFMVIGVTDSDKIHCWTLRQQLNTATVELHCSMDVGRGTTAPSNSGLITSASIFLCPLGMPYVFCAVNHKPGSNLLPTFVVPIETSRVGWQAPLEDERLLPELKSGEVLGGIVTPNGQFIIAIEGKEMVLLTLQAAVDGCLTCLRDPVRWMSPLKAGTFESRTLSILVEESYERLEVVAVDGEGCVLSAEVNVSGMPAPEPPPLIPAPQTPEISGLAAIYQLSSGGSAESSRRSASTTTSGPG